MILSDDDTPTTTPSDLSPAEEEILTLLIALSEPDPEEN